MTSSDSKLPVFSNLSVSRPTLKSLSQINLYMPENTEKCWHRSMSVDLKLFHLGKVSSDNKCIDCQDTHHKHRHNYAVHGFVEKFWREDSPDEEVIPLERNDCQIRNYDSKAIY